MISHHCTEATVPCCNTTNSVYCNGQDQMVGQLIMLVCYTKTWMKIPLCVTTRTSIATDIADYHWAFYYVLDPCYGVTTLAH